MSVCLSALHFLSTFSLEMNFNHIFLLYSYARFVIVFPYAAALPLSIYLSEMSFYLTYCCQIVFRRLTKEAEHKKKGKNIEKC